MHTSSGIIPYISDEEKPPKKTVLLREMIHNILVLSAAEMSQLKSTNKQKRESVIVLSMELSLLPCQTALRGFCGNKKKKKCPVK